VCSHEGFTFHLDVVGAILGPKRVTDLVNESVTDVVVPAYELALAAGTVEAVEWIIHQTDPSVAAAQDTTLRIADVQGRR
jgi:hypothetical protein